MKLEALQKGGIAQPAVDETIQLLAQSIADTRTLIFDLSPPILYELGLKDALSWLAEDLGKRWNIRIVLSDDAFTERLQDATAAILYRAVRELLMNVIKHARAADGFGLFSVREQISRLGGTMEVASGERRGTRVSLRLPLVEHHLSVVPPATAPIPENSAQPRPAT